MGVFWMELYKGAMLELDRVERGRKIAAAYAAVQRRMEELAKGDRDGSWRDERQVLAEALHNLRVPHGVEFNSSTQSGTKRRCREPLKPSLRTRSFECAELLRHLRIVTDPKELAYLNAEVERRAREKQAESKKKST